MNHELTLSVQNLTEHTAEVHIRTAPHVDRTVIGGNVRGPHCNYSRTLAADFVLEQMSLPKEAGSEVVGTIVDPCYWTPKLPFLYKISVNFCEAAGQELRSSLVTGFRRWTFQRENLLLEQKRIVLRGMRLQSPSSDEIELAHTLETALVVPDPSQRVCEEASQFGVSIVADMRTSSESWHQKIQQLDWHPAVQVILVDSDQLHKLLSTEARPQQCLIAECLANRNSSSSMSGDLIAVELAPGEIPPQWLAACGKPVLAIRLNQQTSLPEARRKCDALQAELAPDFDLAGYFV